MENNRSANQTDQFKTLAFDIEYYQSLVDDDTIPEDLKKEFLETLWTIMVQFVDLGFGIESSQLITAAAAKTPAQPSLDRARLTHAFAANAQCSGETHKEKEIV